MASRLRPTLMTIRTGISKPRNKSSDHQRSIQGPDVAPGLSVSRNSETNMSAMTIYERAPIGAMISFRNSVPRPSDEDADALAAWKKCNGAGWLVRCTPPRSSIIWSTAGAISLLPGEFQMDLDAAIAACEAFPLDSDLSFEIVRRPLAGEVRVLQEYGAHSILLYLAANMADARRWVEESGHINIRLEEVCVEEICADVVEGRVA
jgi:hypothetical protein